VNLENQKLQSCYFWLAGHYKKNSKKKEAEGFFNSFIYSNRFTFQDYTRLDVWDRCLQILQQETVDTPVLIIFNQMSLFYSRYNQDSIIITYNYFLNNFAKIVQPVLFIVNKAPIIFNGCKFSKQRRQKKRLVRMSKYRGAD
jgi:hypothetical protein